jgi:very-short-patch-repair endonuclease
MSYRSAYPLRGRQLRRNPSDAERRLWQRLRSGQIAGAKFRRQEPIGPYLVDLCCLTFKLIVEADAGQHAEQG